MVSTSDCHPRGPGFDSQLYPRNFSGSRGSGTGSTQPREDNWVATWLRSSEIRLRKLKLTLIVPRAWEVGYTQPSIKCRGKSATHFVYFWSRKTLPYTHLEATSNIPQQGQSIHILTTSLSTIGCYKISILSIFMNGVYKPICYGNFKRTNWVSAWHYKC